MNSASPPDERFDAEDEMMLHFFRCGTPQDADIHAARAFAPWLSRA
jgi:hypothetical protein